MSEVIDKDRVRFSLRYLHMTYHLTTDVCRKVTLLPGTSPPTRPPSWSLTTSCPPSPLAPSSWDSPQALLCFSSPTTFPQFGDIPSLLNMSSSTPPLKPPTTSSPETARRPSSTVTGWRMRRMRISWCMSATTISTGGQLTRSPSQTKTLP